MFNSPREGLHQQPRRANQPPSFLPSRPSLRRATTAVSTFSPLTSFTFYLCTVLLLILENQTLTSVSSILCLNLCLCFCFFSPASIETPLSQTAPSRTATMTAAVTTLTVTLGGTSSPLTPAAQRWRSRPPLRKVTPPPPPLRASPLDGALPQTCSWSVQPHRGWRHGGGIRGPGPPKCVSAPPPTGGQALGAKLPFMNEFIFILKVKNLFAKRNKKKTQK